MAADRAAGTIVFGRLFTSIGYYLVIPFLTVYLVSELGASAAEAGLLFAVLTFARRGTAIPSGWASDRFGPATVLVTGLGIEAGAYLVFAASETVPVWTVAAALHGLGGSLINMGSRSILAGGAGSAVHFSRYYVMINVAALIGPPAGGLLVERDLVRATFLTAAVLDVLFAVVVAVLLGRRRVTGPARTLRLADMASSLRDPDFLRFCAATLGCWCLLTQLYVALPLTATAQSFSPVDIGLLNAVNALVVIAATWRLGRWVERLDTDRRLRVIGAAGAVMGAGWWLCLLPGIVPLLAAVIVVSLGESLFVSVVDVLSAAFAPEGRTGLYLGTSTMSWAIGATAGSLASGVAFSRTDRAGASPVFWILLGLVGVVSTMLLLAQRDRFRAAVERAQPTRQAG